MTAAIANKVRSEACEMAYRQAVADFYGVDCEARYKCDYPMIYLLYRTGCPGVDDICCIDEGLECESTINQFTCDISVAVRPEPGICGTIRITPLQ